MINFNAGKEVEDEPLKLQRVADLYTEANAKHGKLIYCMIVNFNAKVKEKVKIVFAENTYA